MEGRFENLDENKTRRIELVLQQLDSMPTLSAIAVRLLELTADDESSSRDVINLVSSDPALASKVLRLCHCHERGRASNASTIDRAVLLLGFDAIRSAVLSVQVFETLRGMRSAAGEMRDNRPMFDPQVYWHHSLAVATLSEQIAVESSLRHRLNTGEAFISGLLHDLGQLVLHLILPKSFDRVCELAEAHGISVDHAARRIIGLDSHHAGKRLSEHWRLPQQLTDVMWLHGQPISLLPDLPHRNMIGLITLADAVVRRQHIATLGHGPLGESIEEMCDALSISVDVVNGLVSGLHDEVSNRAAGLGLSLEAGPELLLRSISRANEVLGRINATMRQRADVARRQGRVLEAINRFHESRSQQSSLEDVMKRVVQSAAGIFEAKNVFVIYQGAEKHPWQLFEFSSDDDRPMRSQIITPAESVRITKRFNREMKLHPELLGILTRMEEMYSDSLDMHTVRVLPLPCGWSVQATILHDGSLEGWEQPEQLNVLCQTWAAAVTSAARHETATRLSEKLVDMNRSLMDLQKSVTRSQTMAALGELASGAAHEMNNPLTVISGRSQLLANRLMDPELRMMAEQIVRQSHRLSDIITALRLFANPTKPQRTAVNMGDLVVRVVQSVSPKSRKSVQINTVLGDAIPLVHIDPEHIASALTELVRNAVEAEGSTHIEVRVQIDPFDDRLKIQVTNDGTPMTEHILAHAFDPFFSSKIAGRQPGLGLAQARRLVEAHGGEITLKNGSTDGAVATIWLGNWRQPLGKESKQVA